MAMKPNHPGEGEFHWHYHFCLGPGTEESPRKAILLKNAKPKQKIHRSHQYLLQVLI